MFSFEVNSKIAFGSLVNMNLFNCLLFLAVTKTRVHNLIFVFNKQRAFKVRLLIQGKIKMVLIDDYLASEQQINKTPVPCFIRSNYKYSWMNLIEKTIAKVKNGYQNILKLKSSEIFPFLTDAPMIRYDHMEDIQQKKKLWNIFFKASRKNWVIFTEASEKEKYGLNDSIFIISAFQLEEEKYVKIYFPSTIYDNIITIFNIDLEHEVYKDNIYLKETEIKSKQMLILSFDDYYKIMHKTFAVKYEENYSYYYQKFKVNNKNFQSTILKINKNTNLTLSMHLKNNKNLSRLIVVKLNRTEEENHYNTENSFEFVNFPDKLTKLTSARLSHTNSNVASSLKRKQVNNTPDYSFIYIDSSFGRYEKHNIELNLDEGVYLILFKILIQELEESVILSMYSDFPLKFENTLDFEESKFFENFNSNNKLFLSLFNSYLSLKGVSDNIENHGAFNINSSLNDHNLGYSCIEFTNNSKTKILCINIGYDFTSMNLISHEKQSKNLSKNSTSFGNEVLKIFPGNKEILIFEWEKDFSEINLNFHPKFYTENLYFDSEKMNKFGNFQKKIINEDVFYYEIIYKNKIYLVFCNNNTKYDIKLQVEIQNLNNLAVSNVKNLTNKLNINILRSSKEILIMKVINLNAESSYKMNYFSEKLI